jgi:hypothetical protein
LCCSIIAAVILPLAGGALDVGVDRQVARSKRNFFAAAPFLLVV